MLSLSCDDRPGLVAAIAGFLAERGGNITDAEQYNDPSTGRFFMRVAFDHGPTDPEAYRAGFSALAKALGMDWRLRAPGYRPKVLLMVSRFDHCLADLLNRKRSGELVMDVVAIVSNHPKEALAGSLIGDIPFHHLPVTRDTKAGQEAQVKALVTETSADLVVLARYMQILSDGMAAFLSGRCINIHHSFLPGFKGAKPYHQAHERGVKLIGATAHYVTAELDEGPIIEQEVKRVTHAQSPEDFVSIGREVECSALASAVHAHVHHRVFINGGKTIMFPPSPGSFASQRVG